MGRLSSRQGLGGGDGAGLVDGRPMPLAGRTRHRRALRTSKHNGITLPGCLSLHPVVTSRCNWMQGWLACGRVCCCGNTLREASERSTQWPKRRPPICSMQPAALSKTQHSASRSMRHPGHHQRLLAAKQRRSGQSRGEPPKRSCRRCPALLPAPHAHSSSFTLAQNLKFLTGATALLLVSYCQWSKSKRKIMKRTSP